MDVIITRVLLTLVLLAFCALFGPIAQADTPNHVASINCDAASRSAIIHADSQPSDAKIFTLDDLPDFKKHQKPKTVCDLGPDMKVALTGTVDITDSGHDRSWVSVWIDGIVVNGIMVYPQFGGYVAIGFPDAHSLHIKDCSRNEYTELLSQPGYCRESDYTTTFQPTSHGNPSFDCAKAVTVVELLVCDDRNLAIGDRALAAAYKLAQQYVRDQRRLQEWQRDFISSELKHCLNIERKFFPSDISAAKGCLAQLYTDRLSDLARIAHHFPIASGEVMH